MEAYAEIEPESTMVLPQNVRRLRFINIFTYPEAEFDEAGNVKKYNQKLYKDFTTSVITKDMSEIDRKLFESFAKSIGLDEDTSFGELNAKVNGSVYVFVPAFEWGITKNLTLGVGVPVYFGKMNADVGFDASENADKMIEGLQKDGQYEKAQDLRDKLNNAKAFHDKLKDLGYKPFKTWEGKGLGDIKVGGKYLIYKGTTHSTSLKFGFLAPTGRADDPDNLVDIPFGDGNWKLALYPAYDLTWWKLRLNTHFKYTWNLPAKVRKHVPTADDTLTDNIETVKWNQGDEQMVATSLRLGNLWGFYLTNGYTFIHKNKDSYRGDMGYNYGRLEENTEGYVHTWDVQLGFTTVDFFKKKQFPVPMDAFVSYSYPFTGKNYKLKKLLALNVAMFF